MRLWYRPGTLMIVELIEVSEAPVAGGAAEHPGLGVDGHVLGEVASPWEPFPAHGAAEAPAPGVDVHVFGQRSSPGELFAADRAAELRLPRVDPHVFDQRLAVREAAVTHGAAERLLARVTRHVITQSVRPGEHLAAQRAAERFLCCVNSRVLFPADASALARFVLTLQEVADTLVVHQLGLRTERFVTDDAAEEFLSNVDAQVSRQTSS